jgi:hypothetical protein
VLTFANDAARVWSETNGLDCAYLNDSGTGANSIGHNSNIGECEQNGGYWAKGAINQLSWVQPNVNQDTAVIYSQLANTGIGASLASHGHKAHSDGQTKHRTQLLFPAVDTADLQRTGDQVC